MSVKREGHHPRDREDLSTPRRVRMRQWKRSSSCYIINYLLLTCLREKEREKITSCWWKRMASLIILQQEQQQLLSVQPGETWFSPGFFLFVRVAPFAPSLPRNMELYKKEEKECHNLTQWTLWERTRSISGFEKERNKSADCKIRSSSAPREERDWHRWFHDLVGWNNTFTQEMMI